MKTEVRNQSGRKSLYRTMGNAYHYLNSVQRNIIPIRKKPIIDVEFSTMLCPLSGALNRIGLRKYFDQIAPSDLTKTSVIVLKIENLDNNALEKMLLQFVTDIIDMCGTRDLVARWDINELVLVCPEFSLEHAIELAHKICVTINNKARVNKAEGTCHAIASQAKTDDLNYLINNIKKDFDVKTQ